MVSSDNYNFIVLKKDFEKSISKLKKNLMDIYIKLFEVCFSFFCSWDWLLFR